MSGVGLGIAGLALSIGGMGMSIGQATKAKRKQAEAAQKARVLQAKARASAEKNFYEGLNVPLDAFGEQYRQQLQTQQQAIQSLQEGDSRNLAAGLGNLQMATNQAQEDTRIGMGEALYANRKMKADAKEAMKQQLINIDLGAAQDQVAREQQYGQEFAQGVQGAIASAGQALSAVDSMAPLFGKSGSARTAGKISDDLTKKNLTFKKKKRNPNYDKTKPIDPATGNTPFLMDNQGGFQFDQLTQPEVISLLQSKGFDGKAFRQLRRGEYEFTPGGVKGGFDSPEFIKLFGEDYFFKQ